MENRIFREKNLKKAYGAEELKEYIRVANPEPWLLLTAILVLLVGFLAWGDLGQIETRVPVDVVAQRNAIFCKIKHDDLESIQQGMEVRVGDAKGQVLLVDAETGRAHSDIKLQAGKYRGYIITERKKPLAILFH